MKYAAFSLALVALVMSGCTGPIIMGTDAAVVVATRPGSPPPANTQSQIPEHEDWCYTTMGEPECFAHAQDVTPERLVNVDPQNRYPITLQLYRDEIARNIAQSSSGGMPEQVAIPGSATVLPVEKSPVTNNAGETKTP